MLSRTRVTFGAEVGEVGQRTARAETPTATRSYVSFSGDQIAELEADQITIDSTTLEPEILQRPFFKGGKRELLNYSEIPVHLVHAIPIEDRRFLIMQMTLAV